MSFKIFNMEDEDAFGRIFEAQFALQSINTFAVLVYLLFLDSFFDM